MEVLEEKEINSHTIYHNNKGEVIPSVTTILKIINKPELVKWANVLGLRRKKYEDELNRTSIRGTTIHSLIANYITNTPMILDKSMMPYREIILSGMDRFISWYKSQDIVCLNSELVLTSDLFGGTCDFYGTLDGLYTLIDFKTSKDIYMSMILQLAGYIILLEANGYKVDQVGIVDIPEKEGLKTKFLNRSEMDEYIKVFLLCLDFYINYNRLVESYN
ncbi:MAG: hypothetical protein PHF63_00155 [Herbinix sp.]|nr:hypothetical protein [Herbinix sp.]